MSTQTVSVNTEAPNALESLREAFPDCELVNEGRAYAGSAYERYTMHFPSPEREAEFNQWIEKHYGSRL